MCSGTRCPSSRPPHAGAGDDRTRRDHRGGAGRTRRTAGGPPRAGDAGAGRDRGAAAPGDRAPRDEGAPACHRGGEAGQPLQGRPRPNRRPGARWRRYEAGGATAVSMLTERRRFGGSAEDLAAVRARVTLPVL
ncbi:hypothetical protein ABT372_26360 [Streptomyces lydicus]